MSSKPRTKAGVHGRTWGSGPMADDKDSGAGEFFRQHYTTPDFGGAAKPRPKANGTLAPEPPPAEPSGPDAAGWLARCQIAKGGEPLPNLHNALIAMRH